MLYPIARCEPGPITIASLQDQIKHLERSERRHKTVLRTKTDQLKELVASVEGVRKLLADANAMIGKLGISLGVEEARVRQYRNWWLTERYALEVVFAQVPEAARIGLESTMASSRERYEDFCQSSGQWKSW